MLGSVEVSEGSVGGAPARLRRAGRVSEFRPAPKSGCGPEPLILCGEGVGPFAFPFRLGSLPFGLGPLPSSFGP